MRITPRARPMFTIFVSNAKNGQRLRFKENDFRIECNLLARGMSDAKTLRDQGLSCIHKRCRRYVDTVNELKQALRSLDVEIPTLRSCLDVEDIVEIAKASRLLELLHVPARWSRTMMERTAVEDRMISKYSALIDSEREIERTLKKHFLLGKQTNSSENDETGYIPRDSLRRFYAQSSLPRL
jgi:hypothetical protein